MSSGLLVMRMPAGSIHKDPYNCTLSKKLEKWESVQRAALFSQLAARIHHCVP